MAETSRNLDIALRIRADLKSATDGLRALENEIRKTGQTADDAGDQTKKLANANDSATAAMSRSEKQARSLGIAIGVMVAAMTAAGVVLVKSTLDYDQKLGDMSKKVGVSTETLSALGDVARKNGSDLQGVQRGFVDLARAATDGSSRAARALTAMGIPLKEFQSLTSSQRFDLVAQKFAGYADGANKAALATALFGQRGVELIPTLNQVGNEGLQNITDKAIEAGTAVGQDAVDASNAFSNALADLRAKLQGAVNDGLAQFTPYIEQLSNLINDPQFQENLKATAKGIAAVGMAAINAANGVVTFVRGAAEVTAFQRTGVIASETGYQAALARLNADRAELAKRAPEDANAFTQLSEKSARLRRAVFTTSDSATHAALKDTKDLTAEVADLTAKTDAYAKSRKAANDADAGKVLTGNQVPAWMKAGLGGGSQAPIVPGAGGGKTDNSAQREAEKIARDAARAQDQLTQSLIVMQSQLDPTAQAWATYNAAVKKANEQAELAKKAPGANATAIDSERDAVIGLAATMRDASLDKIAEADEKAWQSLLDSLRTPAEVNADKAVEQLDVLNKRLRDGKISADEYRATLQKLVSNALPDAPRLDFRGLVPSGIDNGGPMDAVQQQQDKEVAAYHARMQALQQLRQKEAIDQAQFDAQAEAENQRHAAAMGQVQQAMYWGELATASQAFGQLAQVAAAHYGEQSKQYAVLFALSKAFAIAQAAASLAINVSKASEVGFPYNIPFIVGAFAQGAQIVSLIAGANYSGGGGGYADGGYTGAGGKHQVAGLVHAGEVVWSQADIARAGGVGTVETMRLRGYADGGFVNPLANAPSPAQMGFSAPSMPRTDFSKLAAANDDRTGGASRVVENHYHVWSEAEAAERIAAQPAMQKAIIHIVGDNGNKIRGKWR